MLILKESETQLRLVGTARRFSFQTGPNRAATLRRRVLYEPFMGFEPMTSSLPRKCSTTELKRLV